MRNRFIIIIWLVIFTISATQIYCKEWVPEYRITKDVVDSTLKKNEALFLFNFYDSNGKAVQKEMKIGYNGINKNIQPLKKGNFQLKVNSGKYLLQFYSDKKHYEVTTDSISIKSQHRIEMRVEFRSSEFPTLVEKPVIYVYPSQTTMVNIKLDVKGKLLFTYPQYLNGWNFTAEPDGTIKMDEKKYHYLFWDGEVEIKYENTNLNEGFIVEKENLVKFFEEKLAAMGLNSKETEDFITYWCPRMSINEKNFVHFIFNEEYDQYASLTIEPKPDKLFRVFMFWSAYNSNGNLQVIEQKLPAFQRTGFSVVEWGGAEILKPVRP